jgi:hypothetical protein
MTPIFARFKATEVALHSLRASLVQYKSINVTVEMEKKNRRLRPLGLPAHANDRMLEGLFLQVVTIVESYLDALSYYRLLHSPNVPDDVRDQVDQFFSDTTRSWKNRERAYKRYHSFDLATCVRFGDYKAATVIRNCIAHGLGELTSLQRTDKSLVANAQVLDVAVTGNRMLFGRDTFGLLFAICEELILQVDNDFPD